MDPPSAGPGAGAGAGAGARGPKACTACAASKARCIFAEETTAATGKCNRCNRLNKPCVMQMPAVRTRRPKNVTRVAQLEDKLESLVARLSNPPQQSALPQLQFNDASVDTVQPSVSPSEPTPGGSSSSQYGASPSPHQHLTPTSSGQPHTEGIPRVDIRNPEALLALYRAQVSDQFPFVVIPQDVKAYELMHEKPLLFKAICMVTSAQDVKAQGKIAEEIMEYLSVHVLIKAEKSIHILQGLLIFIAWFHCHIHQGRRLSILLNLAAALITDLKLDSAPLVGLKREAKIQEFWNYPNDILGSETRTLDEIRAYLGYVHVASVVSIYIPYRPPPRRNPYIQECVDIIQRSPEFQSDIYLVQLMRLQSIGVEMSTGLPRDDDIEFIPMSSTTAAHMKTIQSKLDVFQERVPSHLRNNPVLLMHYHNVLVYLTETALYIPSLPSRPATLNACLNSIMSFFAALFSVPIMQYFKIPYPSWVQVNYTLSVLAKLSLFDSDDWDVSHVPTIVDLSFVLDGMLARFTEVVALRRKLTGRNPVGNSGLDADDGLFGVTLPRMQQNKAAFERRRADIMRTVDERHGVMPAFTSAPEPPMQMTEPMMMDMAYGAPLPLTDFHMPPLNFSKLDDAFWMELMGDHGVN